MVSKSFKVLEVINGYEYAFSSFAFKASIRKYKSERKNNDANVTSEMILEELADTAHVTVDSIKNWMYAKNGPGDLETVKAIAEILHVNYMELLTKREKKTMLENNIVVPDNKIDMEKTKDVIRVVYQKMSAFMDAVVEELCFDSDEETFWSYEEVYKDMLGTLHKSMLDIPIGIYDQLREIAEGDLHMYMYGIEEGTVEIWDLSEFCNFCRVENIDGPIAQRSYLQQKSKEFYINMREILKDYLLA